LQILKIDLQILANNLQNNGIDFEKKEVLKVGQLHEHHKHRYLNSRQSLV